MKKFFTLLRYELTKIVVSPSSYFVVAIFLAIISAVFLFMLREYILFDQDLDFVHAFFQCYWLPALLSIPMLTMRIFSDDYRTGFMQVIKSSAVSDFAIICSKFVAVYLFYVVLWGLVGLLIGGTLIIFPSLSCDSCFISPASAVGGYLYILVSGLVFISIGVFFSSLTENQILAGMSTFVAIFLLFLNGQLFSFRKITSEIFDSTFVRPMNFFLQLDNSCFGVFDSRVFVLYLTLTLLFIIFTKISLETKFR